MGSDHRPGALPVQVQVPAVEFNPGLIQTCAAAGIGGAGQAVIRVVGNLPSNGSRGFGPPTVVTDGKADQVTALVDPPDMGRAGEPTGERVSPLICL